MKIVFFGTSSFADHILRSLVKMEHHQLCAVVTKEDKQQGRGRKVLSSPVKIVAEEICPAIPLHQPRRASSVDFQQILEEYQADLFVVVAYGELLKQNILDLPKICCINIHASLLPKYRGAAPIQRAIIDGERESGVAIMKMELKLDAGDVFTVKNVEISPDMTFEQLDGELRVAGVEALHEVIDSLEVGSAVAVPQDESGVTYAHKIELEDCRIDWNLSANQLHNLVRGVTPIPGAWFTAEIAGQRKRVKVRGSKNLPEISGKPGEVIKFDKKGLLVGCGAGALLLENLQIEGKKMLPVSALCNGIDRSKFGVVVE